MALLDLSFTLCTCHQSFDNTTRGLGKLFHNLLGVVVDPKPPLAELNGFLLAASWLGFPPRPLKNPPPLPVLPAPNTLPLEDGGC